MKNKFLTYLWLAIAVLMHTQAGFAQKKTILVTPGGRPLGGPGAAFILSGAEVVETPVATNIAVGGTTEVGQQLNLTYSYFDAQNDPEGTTTFQWYRADNATGTNKAAISGANGLSYVPVAADLGKYLTAGVTPVAQSGPSTGPEAFSASLGAIACPANVTVNHVAGLVSPQTATITYNVVESNLSGTSRCWILTNLGASQAPSAATDYSDEAAGWYWQFNRKQGFTRTAATTAPYTGWESTIDPADVEWDAQNDPCSLLLGSAWSIPASSDWNFLSGMNYLTSYDSVLKLHLGGLIYNNTLYANYESWWGRSRDNPTADDINYGLTIRCITK